MLPKSVSLTGFGTGAGFSSGLIESYIVRFAESAKAIVFLNTLALDYDRRWDLKKDDREVAFKVRGFDRYDENSR